MKLSPGIQKLYERASRSRHTRSHHLTRPQVVAMFREAVPRSLKQRDLPAYREAWGVFLDGLHKDGQITARAYERWDAP